MITVEVILPSGTSAFSLPLDATKDEILESINTDPWIDFPCRDQSGSYVACLPTQFIVNHCPIVIREVE